MIAIVSNIAFLHSFGRAVSAGAYARSYCKNRRIRRHLVRSCSAVLVAIGVAAVPVRADDGVPERTSTVVSTLKFFSGAALAFGMHETGHLVFDVAFGADPHLKRVDFGGIPFFAITHDAGVSPRREFTISSAGFWVQHATDEWLLTSRPHLRSEEAALAKGMLAFNVLTSVGYSMAAFAKVGPFERDTRGMADAVRVDERVIGALVLAPAVLDAYRYYRPDSRWARWVSRGVKIGGVLLIVR